MKQQNRKELLLFLIITFGIMYGMGFTAIVFLPSIEKIFGPISNRNPLAMFLIYSPTISALIMTTAKEGSSGLWNLFKAAVRRTKPVYWIVSILFIPVLILVLGIVQPFTPLIETSFNPDIYLKTFPLILFSLEIFRDAGPLGEELNEYSLVYIQYHQYDIYYDMVVYEIRRELGSFRGHPSLPPEYFYLAGGYSLRSRPLYHFWDGSGNHLDSISCKTV